MSIDSDLWAIGASMARLEREPDRTAFDLDAAAALAALDDAGIAFGFELNLPAGSADRDIDGTEQP